MGLTIEDTRQPEKSAASVRSTVTKVHSWSGAILFVLVFLVSLSGALSVFAGDMFRWQYGDAVLADDVPEATPPATPAELLDAAMNTADEPFQPAIIMMPDSRFFMETPVVIGTNTRANKPPEQVFLTMDPYTAEHNATIDVSESWTSLVVHFHDSLLLGEGGAVTIAAIGILMILFTLTGLYQWWPRDGYLWRKASNFRLRGGTYSKMFKLHGLVGLWLAPLVILWSFTGTYLSQPDWFGNVFAPPSMDLSDEETAAMARSCGSGSVTLAQAFDAAQSHTDGQQLKMLLLPRDESPYEFLFQGNSALNKHYGDTTVSVSATCADTVVTKTPENLNFSETLGAMMFSLHTGRTFGPLRIPLVLLTGLLLSIMSAAGLYVWWKKTFRRTGHRYRT